MLDEDLKFLEGYKAQRSKFFPPTVTRAYVPPPPPPKELTEAEKLKIWIRKELVNWKQKEPKRKCDRIKREVCLKYDLSDATLLIDDRVRKRIIARAELYCRLRIECEWSYPMIGRYAGLDHSTINHAVLKYAKQLGYPKAAESYPFRK